MVKSKYHEVDMMRYNLGIETIAQLGMLAHTLKRNEIKISEKTFEKFLDSLPNLVKQMNIRADARPLELRLKIHGHKTIIDCCNYAALIAKKCDYDVFEKFGLTSNELKQLVQQQLPVRRTNDERQN